MSSFRLRMQDILFDVYLQQYLDMTKPETFPTTTNDLGRIQRLRFDKISV